MLIRPQKGPQEQWLSSPADIAIYGGAAFGGKSFALLMEPLRHVDKPGFGGTIFRRTSKQVEAEGGLWDTSGLIYPFVGAIPKVGDLDWRFPRGANVGFAHLQHEKNKLDWQGSQIPFIGFDELTHFSESQFWYMISRNRDGSGCGVKPYVRGTTNPDAGSWVKRLLAPWVDRKFKDPARSGEIRWLIRLNGQYHWGRSREEMQARFPKLEPKSVTFVRASIWDNKIGMARDPGYLSNLHAQSTVEKARLLDGDWDVVNEGLVYPELGSRVIEVEDWPEDLQGKRVGGIDWGFRDPFAGLLAIEDVQGHLWVYWEHYQSRMDLTAISKTLPRIEGNEPRWWADPAGATQIAEIRRADHDVIGCAHLGQEPIKSGVAMVTQRIRDRTISFHGSLGCLIDEAGKYRYPEAGRGDPEKPEDKDNHLMDALRYLVVGNDRGRAVKDEAPPESDEHRQARIDQEKAERSAEEEDYYDPDADHWWVR
jgi:hypothetical protein